MSQNPRPALLPQRGAVLCLQSLPKWARICGALGWQPCLYPLPAWAQTPRRPGKPERAVAEVRTAVHYSPGSCSRVCSPPWGGRAVLNASWKEIHHLSLLQASHMPVPSLLRSKAQTWSRGCNLFTIPLLLLALRCVCTPHSSHTFCPTASPPCFPRGVKRSTTQSCAGCRQCRWD